MGIPFFYNYMFKNILFYAILPINNAKHVWAKISADNILLLFNFDFKPNSYKEVFNSTFLIFFSSHSFGNVRIS